MQASIRYSVVYLAVCLGLGVASTACTGSRRAPIAPNETTTAAQAGDRPSAAAQALPAETRMASFEEFIRIRCTTDGRDVYTTWTGVVFAAVPGERQRLLFKVIGMNVARCWREDSGWFFTSRELMYYLDPKSGEVLHKWSNPWTQETLPVVHVANSPIQGPLRRPVPIELTGDAATVSMDIPLFYPNSLSKDEKLAPFSPRSNYQASEFFNFTTRRSDATDSSLTTVPNMTFTWHRVGPWLPWMKMGDRPGVLLYSARGSKVAGYEQLPDVIRADIDSRMPLYRAAPRCLLEQRNETSWSYFAKHFQAFQNGDRFPVPEPVRDEPCKQATR